MVFYAYGSQGTPSRIKPGLPFTRLTASPGSVPLSSPPDGDDDGDGHDDDYEHESDDGDDGDGGRH